MSQRRTKNKPTNRSRNHAKNRKDKSVPSFIYTAFGKDQHKPPVFEADRRHEWVKFGEDNGYPKYLLDLFNMSGKHNAIITGKVDRIIGKGWSFDPEGIDEAEIAKHKAIINGMNGGDRLIDITRPVVMDEELYNGIAIEVIYNLAGELSSIHHVDFGKIRKVKDDVDDESLRGKYIYSEGWHDQARPLDEKYNPQIFAPYDPSKPTGKQLIYWQGYRPGADDYPLPEYIGSTAAIETDIEISNWHLNNIKHGFSGGYIINFSNGIPSEEEQKKIEKQIIKKHTGSDASGRFILNFSDSKETAVEVTPITPNNFDKQFDQLTNQTLQGIFTGHKVTSPMMFGVKTPGQLGGRSEIIDAEELFENTYTKQKRPVIEDIFNMIFQDAGINTKLFLQPSQTMSFQFSETTIAQAMTTPEIRDNAANMGILLQAPQEGEEDTTAQNAVAEALSVLSPLIATKVLETMTTNEVRALVGLKGEVTPEGMKKLQQFVAQQEDQLLIEQFEKLGQPADRFRTLKKVPLLSGFRNEKAVALSELNLTKQYFAPALTITITTMDRRVLDLISKDSKISIDQIADIVGVSQNEVADVIDRLQKGGALKIEQAPDAEGDAEVVREVTEEGRQAIDQEQVPIAEVQVMYRYVTRPDVPPAKSGSRPFCVRMLAMNKLFTREEIDQVSISEARNVWQRRGGFYNNPETGQTTPYCRHIWQQEIVTTIN